MLKISISGVRGFVPESLTPQVCLDFAKGFGTFLNDACLPARQGKVVVGTDSRASSEFIKGIIFSGLLSAGCSVVDLGICPTPTVAVMVRELKAAGGLVITASHNPLPWNGLKFMGPEGIFLNAHEMEKLIQLYQNKKFKGAPSRGVTANSDAVSIHIQKVIKAVNPAKVARKRFRVALDAGNGAGCFAGVQLLKKLGCEVIEVNCDPKKPFPRHPEPTPENLTELSRIIKNRKADIGFGLDSDADRLSIVTEEGQPVSEECTLALAVKYVLGRSKNLPAKRKVVAVNLSTSQMVEEITKSLGGKIFRTKVGEVHVAEELKNLKGLIGGEGNGGVIFPKVNYNRDSLSAMALVLAYLAASGKKISELIAELPQFHMVKKRITVRNPNDLMDEVKFLFRRETKDLTEGIKVIGKDAWLHVRPSNTEPIVRVIAEGRTKSAALKLIHRLQRLRA